MQAFIKLQNILLDGKRTFEDFRQELIKSQITQFTYLCLLLNYAATLKRPNFNFQPYLDLLADFKNQPGYRSACINYTGYKDKISILMNACEKSVLSTVKILVTHPDIKLYTVDPNGFNAVFYAIKNCDENESIKILQLLYDLSPQMIDTVCNNGYSPLFLAVQKSKLKVIEFLLSHGIDANIRLISSGNTALHQMIKVGSKHSLQQIKRTTQIFLRYGFDINTRNNQFQTIQEYSFECSNNKFNLTEILRQLQLQQQRVNQTREWSQTTQVYSTKMATTKIGDVFTSYQYSSMQLQRSEYYHHQMDALSISHKSLLSQEINCLKYEDQRQLSLDMNIHNNQSMLDQDELIDYNNLQIDQIQKKIECQSLSDSPQSGDCFDLSQNLLPFTQFTQNQILQDQYLPSQSQSETQSESSSQDNANELFLKTEQIDFIKIHQQLLQFDQKSQQIYFSAWKEIQPFFVKFTQLIAGLGLSIEIIGSFATTLWTSHSDIDIALVTQSDSYVDFQKLLEKVYSKIKVRMYDMGIRQLSYNKASKIPSLKIQMDPYLFTSRKIDIMITHKKNMAITYVNYIREALTIYHQIRPLFFFLKRACEQFALHDPFNGGMKSYSIFLLINSIIRSLELTNLGEILLKISLYFGFYHTYDYQIEYHHNINLNSIEYCAVQRLNISDPLNTKNNMGGRNTNCLRLKNMFRTIYYGIHKQNDANETKLQQILQMAQLIL